MDVRTLFLSPRGRLGRTVFWVGWLALVGIGHFAQYLPLLGQVVILFLAYCSTCLHVKRLHDLGLAGGWAAIVVAVWLIMTVTPMLSVLGYLPESQSTILNLPISMLAFYGSFAIWFGLMIWLGFAKGQPSENRYGEPPMPPAQFQ